MKIKDKVLIVEDEQSISNFISMILTANGYDTIIVRSGEEALTMIASHCPDMIVLDLGLPDMDGMEVLKSVRKWSNLPVVVVSARNHEHDKVEALDYGADDYLVKPFGTSELLARIRTAIRHTRTTLSNTQIAQSGKFVTGDLTIDYDKHQVLMHGENAGLTVNEYKIVALLGKYAGKVLTYDFIIRELWGPKAKTDNQILRVNMANIRRKIEPTPGNPQYIFTEVGVGYRMREGAPHNNRIKPEAPLEKGCFFLICEFLYKKKCGDENRHFTGLLYVVNKGKYDFREADVKKRLLLFTRLFSRGKIQIRPLGGGGNRKERRYGRKKRLWIQFRIPDGRGRLGGRPGQHLGLPL